ncbi:MAG: hypothetical protein AAF251_05280 [Pseudomonadota bacterium]
MNKLERYRKFFTFLLASISIPATYYGRMLLTGQGMSGSEGAIAFTPSDKEFWTFIISSFFFLVSVSPAGWLVDKVFEYQAVRRFLLGKRFVEGYWSVDSTKVKGAPADGAAKIFQRPAVLFIEYCTDDKKLTFTTTRYNEWGEKVVTQAIAARIEDAATSLMYLNFFALPLTGNGEAYGFARGRFSKSDGRSKHYDHLETVLSLQSPPTVGTQNINRIKDCDVEALQHQHRDDWIWEFLEPLDQAVFKFPELDQAPA